MNFGDFRAELRERVIAWNTIPMRQKPQCAAEKPCKTCPFVAGNDIELARLSVDMNHPGPFHRFNRAIRPLNKLLVALAPHWCARMVRRVARQIASSGPFSCHASVYKFDGANTTVRPQSEWRLCKGAESIK